MAGFIPVDVIERVRSAADIVDVVRRYVPLQRKGRSFVALCPFHNEKTPSFNVHPEKQIYRCFGCGEGGNVFSFIMAQERVSFPEAVKMVAERYGITIRTEESGRGVNKDAKKALYDLNEWAGRQFEEQLKATPGGARTREYLEARGIGEDVVQTARLGYAPDSWDFLLKQSSRGPRSENAMAQAGLVVARQGGDGYYDRFRNRLIFPVIDTLDRVVGFGARALEDGQEPKYLNSPETPIFNKGRNLYGLNWAKNPVLQDRRAIIVEGYTDVLMARQHGVEPVVATLGTAVTKDHARLLRRYADEVVLVFDSDAAGQKASDRGLEVFIEEDLDVRVAVLPEGHDPCSLLEEEGAEAFRSRVSDARGLFAFKVGIASTKWDLTRAHGKSKAIADLLGLVSRIKDPVRKDLTLQEIAHEMSVSVSSLRQSLAAATRRTAAPEEGPRKAELRLAKTERELLSILIFHDSVADRIEELLGDWQFSSDVVRALFEAAFELKSRKGEIAVADLIANLPSPEQGKTVTDIACTDAEIGNYEKRLVGCAEQMQRRRAQQEMATIPEELSRAKACGDIEHVATLLRRQQELARGTAGPLPS